MSWSARPAAELSLQVRGCLACGSDNGTSLSSDDSAMTLYGREMLEMAQMPLTLILITNDTREKLRLCLIGRAGSAYRQSGQ